MCLRRLGKRLVHAMTFRKFNNIIEALNMSKIMRKLVGMTIYVMEITPDNKRVMAKFSWVAFCSYVMWYTTYFYCTYKAHEEDQTMIRSLYNTKLNRYGDDIERIASLLFVLFAMIKIPYNIRGSVRFMQMIVDLDKDLEKLGVYIDYNKDAYLAVGITVGQLILYSIRLLCIYFIFDYINVPVPKEMIFQMVFCDSLTLVSMSYFGYFLITLRCRFNSINKVLVAVKQEKSFGNKILVMERISDSTHCGNLDYQRSCHKIRECSRIYGNLYKAVVLTNELYGIMLAMTMNICLFSVVLYMFYLMEATAAGLFHEIPRYINFLGFVLWQIVFTAAVVFFVVYLAEAVMQQAKHTSFLTHEIIYSDISPTVTAEGMQLSLQLLHQNPQFTANGLYTFNYALIQEAARTVFTYLVILLQFVTGSK